MSFCGTPTSPPSICSMPFGVFDELVEPTGSPPTMKSTKAEHGQLASDQLAGAAVGFASMASTTRLCDRGAVFFVHAIQPALTTKSSR